MLLLLLLLLLLLRLVRVNRRVELSVHAVNHSSVDLFSADVLVNILTMLIHKRWLLNGKVLLRVGLWLAVVLADANSL